MRTDVRIVIAFDHAARGRVRSNAHHDPKIHGGIRGNQRLAVACHEPGLR